MSVKIHGKDYITVDERVQEFHKKYKNGSIQTKLVSFEGGVVIIKAHIYPDVSDTMRKFTGYAYEEIGSSQINKTSALENCETSAVGRALGFLNIGLGGSIASANEVQNAVKQQQNDEFKGNSTIAPKPLTKMYKDMLTELTKHKDHAALNKSQKEKITTLVSTVLSMRDKDTIERYHDITLNLVSEHEARAKSNTIKEK